MRKQKTLADFPRFTVHSLRKYPPGDQGYTDFELEGTFDRTIQRSAVTWFWLLSGERESLCVQWKSQDDTIAPTVLVGCQKDVPQLDGAILFYLNPYWQPFHVWMVLDSQWGWEKVKFEASDAVALETEGREVKGWTKLKRTDSDDQSSQQYPVNKDASGTGSLRKAGTTNIVNYVVRTSTLVISAIATRTTTGCVERVTKSTSFRTTFRLRASCEVIARNSRSSEM